MVKNLTRWEDPFSSLTSLHSQLDDMFSNFFTGGSSTVTRGLPTMDVYTKDDKELVAEVHAPGFDKDDIDVSVHQGVLEIKGEKHTKEDEKDKRSYMMRESSTSFYRRVVLPRYANSDEVQAKFDNGVLKVSVPIKELPKPKRVAIQASK